MSPKARRHTRYGQGRHDPRGPNAGQSQHGWAREGWSLRSAAVLACGLGVVAAVLVPTALQGQGPDAASYRPVNGTYADPSHSGGAPRTEGRGSTHTGRHQPALRPAAGPEPEVCEDGEDPVESLKASKASGPAVERIKDEGQLVVGVDQSSYLWGFRDPATGDFAGFDIDLVKAIGKDLLGPDPRITFKTVPTNERVQAIQDGAVDMVVRTMSVNCDRIKKVAFSTAYFEAGQQLVVPKEKSGVEGIDGSLRGKRLCVAESSTAESLMKRPDYKALGARIFTVDNQLDCLVQMQLGRTDATLTDNALGAGQAAQDPSVELVGEPETMEPYGVAMNLEDEDLVRRVNKVLEDYRDKGWPESYEKWFGGGIMGSEDDGKPPEPPEAEYRD